MIITNVHLVTHPYEEMIPKTSFIRILHDAFERRARDVAARFATGEYKSPTMGFVGLDPTAPFGRPASEAVMAWGYVGGAGGSRSVVSAFAKVRDLWQLGPEYMRPECRGSNAFRHAGAIVRGRMFVGSGGQEVPQDMDQGIALADDLNTALAAEIGEWEADQPEGWRWYSQGDEAPLDCLAILKIGGRVFRPL